jgi:phosphatidylserine synthase
MRWNWGYFGVKDLFTTINLVGGTVGIHYAVLGNLEYAAFAAFGGFLFGDALDGPVARITKSGNKFGSEYDRIVDHLSQTVTPAIILYRAYQMDGHPITGIILMTVLLMAASVRHARGMTDEFRFPAGFYGANRTVSGILALSLPNTELFWKMHAYWYEIGIGTVVLAAILNLAPIPYVSHRPKGRTLQWYAKAAAWVFILVPIALVFVARQFVFDAIFFCTMVYCLTAWIPVTRDERKQFYEEYRRWQAAVIAAK